MCRCVLISVSVFALLSKPEWPEPTTGATSRAQLSLRLERLTLSREEVRGHETTLPLHNPTRVTLTRCALLLVLEQVGRKDIVALIAVRGEAEEEEKKKKAPQKKKGRGGRKAVAAKATDSLREELEALLSSNKAFVKDIKAVVAEAKKTLSSLDDSPVLVEVPRAFLEPVQRNLLAALKASLGVVDLRAIDQVGLTSHRSSTYSHINSTCDGDVHPRSVS